MTLKVGNFFDPKPVKQSVVPKDHVHTSAAYQKSRGGRTPVSLLSWRGLLRIPGEEAFVFAKDYVEEIISRGDETSQYAAPVYIVCRYADMILDEPFLDRLTLDELHFSVFCGSEKHALDPYVEEEGDRLEHYPPQIENMYKVFSKRLLREEHRN